MDLSILVDMDGVLVNTMAGFNKELARQYPGISLIPVDKISKFDILKLYPEEYKSSLRKIWATPGFFSSLTPIEGSKEAIFELASYADIAICTSPYSKSPTCAQEKWQWVEEHLGKEWLERLIITKDKTRVSGTILIDDKPVITGARTPLWEHVLYTQPWNVNVTGKRRLTWSNWRDVLTELV